MKTPIGLQTDPYSLMTYRIMQGWVYRPAGYQTRLIISDLTYIKKELGLKFDINESYCQVMLHGETFVTKERRAA